MSIIIIETLTDLGSTKLYSDLTGVFGPRNNYMQRIMEPTRNGLRERNVYSLERNFCCPNLNIDCEGTTLTDLGLSGISIRRDGIDGTEV